MKIVTLNANGLRSSIRKGLRDWVRVQQPDILCIQETKAQCEKLDPSEYTIEGYDFYYCDSERAGHSGVAIYSRLACQLVKDRLWSHTYVVKEGRVLVMAYTGFTLINVYLPSGTMGEVRQSVKWLLMQDFKVYLDRWKDQPCIVVGDFNIAHKPIDLKNWKNNQNSTGFLPYEREWMSELLDSGWVDTLRYLKPELALYTWWSLRSKARANNVGWRIDYQLITAPYAEAILNAYVDNEKILSDHAPYVVEYSYEKLLHQKL